MAKSANGLALGRIGQVIRYSFRPWVPVALGAGAFVINVCGYFIFVKPHEKQKL